MEDELLDFDDILQDSDEGYTPRSNSPDLDATADEKVIKESALDAAHKLESQYELTYKNIDDIRRFVEENINRRTAEEQDVDETIDLDISVNSHVSFQLDEVDFPTPPPISQQSEDTDRIPLHDRLLSYGNSLKMKKEKMRKEHEEEPDHKPQISDLAKKITREERIEDSLMKRKIEHDARIEEMRTERLKQEMKQLSSPKISKSAKQLKRSEPAYERLFEARRQNLDRREEMRNKLAERELQQTTGKPMINKSSRTLSRTVEDQLEWEREKRQKAETLRKQKQDEELNQIKKPKINSISAKIASMQDRAPVHERLQEEARRRKEDKQKKLQQEYEKVLNESVPMISIHSANLQRDEYVFDRLYQSSLEHDEKRKYIDYQHDILLKKNIDPNTGMKMHSPIINPRSAAIVRSQPVENILLQKAELKKAKIEEAKKRDTLQYEESHPRAGAYSQFLVEVLEKRTNTTTMDRLTKTNRANKENRERAIVEEEEKECTFRPKINEKSRIIDKAKAPSNNRSSQLYQKATEYDLKKRILKEQFSQESTKECTFSPKHVAHIPSNHSGTTIAERSSEWARKIDQKLEMERMAASEKELEGCTFRPKTTGKDNYKVHNNSSTYSARSAVSNFGRTEPQTKPRSSSDVTPSKYVTSTPKSVAASSNYGPRKTPVKRPLTEQKVRPDSKQAWLDKKAPKTDVKSSPGRAKSVSTRRPVKRLFEEQIEYTPVAEYESYEFVHSPRRSSFSDMIDPEDEANEQELLLRERMSRRREEAYL